MKSQAGVTLLELLLVIALVGLVAGAATPFLSRFVLQTHLDVVTDQVVGSLRRAQAFALDGRGGGNWGVCVTGGVVRVFRDTCASPGESIEYPVPGSVTVTGLTNVSFNQRGEPSAATTVTISSAIETRVVSVNSAGGMAIN